ncbi:hypothetical protein B0H19DRAFT_1065288 [Mycena capillaripes]|nr:hypothetical protein B0H19DRAFT_1065288 [Mycena capillaripes]
MCVTGCDWTRLSLLFPVQGTGIEDSGKVDQMPEIADSKDDAHLDGARRRRRQGRCLFRIFTRLLYKEYGYGYGETYANGSKVAEYLVADSNDNTTGGKRGVVVLTLNHDWSRREIEEGGEQRNKSKTEGKREGDGKVRTRRENTRTAYSGGVEGHRQTEKIYRMRDEETRATRCRRYLFETQAGPEDTEDMRMGGDSTGKLINLATR